MTGNIFNISSDLPFARTLAQKILDETADKREALPSYLILLPNRRACRTLQDMFFELNKGQAILLPRMEPIGDVEEESLSLLLSQTDLVKSTLEIPPSISPLRRQLLLAHLITGLQQTHAFSQSLALAKALGHFLDQIYIENLDFANLENLVPEEFAEHWKITTGFLKILEDYWPKILEEHGVIDMADRRNRLMHLLGQYWQKHPPLHPVIAAGTTGSIPATADLLKIIADLPQGRIILPGLDTAIDEESWNTLEQTHPQAGLRKLLSHLNIDRRDVSPWDDKAHSKTSNCLTLAREIMRPAATAYNWANLATNKTAKADIEASLKNISLIECSNENEEAQSIALLLRETLEKPGKTATLITSNRTLARRVITACLTWDIHIDDSAGTPLDHTKIGSLFTLMANAKRTRLSPVALLSLLQHPLCNAGLPHTEIQKTREHIDQTLRGLKPKPGLDGLTERLGPENSIVGQLTPFFKDENSLDARDFSDWLTWHIECCEAFAATPDKSGSEILWQEGAAEEARNFFQQLSEHASLFPKMAFHDYADILTQLMHETLVRPHFGTHPRLRILGQLEARMADADRVILGDLNEGSWPPDPGHDPWMSKPMRETFGLRSLDEFIGLAAHDFIQGFCNAEVIITRALKKEGTPTVPARWLQRLDTVLQAAGIPITDLHKSPALKWTQSWQSADIFKPVQRPMPTPPAESRPRRLSVTRIETWLKDPYSIYAGSILKLKKLDPLEKDIDAAEHGSLLHEILHEFFLTYPDSLPANAAEILKQIAHKKNENFSDDERQEFWQIRFEKIAEKFIEIETAWREQAAPLASEIKGALDMAASGLSFTLSAEADRIDKLAGGMAIIDYKSGGNFTKTGIESGEYPQLPLEALILQQGGFAELGRKNAEHIAYWKLSGGADTGKIVEVSKNLESLITRTEAGLKNLVTTFSNAETPYINIPHADRLPRFNDYKHLARIAEWGVFSDEDNSSEAA